MTPSVHPSQVSLRQALQLIAKAQLRREEEDVALEACCGRRLARDVFADVSLPPHNASAMDGFAVRLQDVANVDAKLTLIGEVAAGAANNFKLAAGETVRVFTGAPMPVGADHVLIQEHADIRGKHVIVTKAQPEPRHIRNAGGDFCRGDRVLAQGMHLGPRHIGLAAAANHASLWVERRPKVAILTTGSELRRPGSLLAAGQIAESNSYTLSKFLERRGAVISRIETAGDTEDRIETLFQDCAEADILITAGGASVGKHDLVRKVFTQIGGVFEFEGIAVRPGKPTWFGRLKGQRVLGLPGNPTAAFVMMSLLVGGLLYGADALETTDAVLATPLPQNGVRETFMRARMTLQKGTVRVEALSDQDTSRVQALTVMNCLIHRARNDGARDAGALVPIVALE